ncbi:hypothetical protein [Sphingobacterium sp. E70]
MPELEWYYGYPIAMAIMIVISMAIYLWFKEKVGYKPTFFFVVTTKSFR